MGELSVGVGCDQRSQQSDCLKALQPSAFTPQSESEAEGNEEVTLTRSQTCQSDRGRIEKEAARGQKGRRDRLPVGWTEEVVQSCGGVDSEQNTWETT